MLSFRFLVLLGSVVMCAASTPSTGSTPSTAPTESTEVLSSSSSSSPGPSKWTFKDRDLLQFRFKSALGKCHDPNDNTFELESDDISDYSISCTLLENSIACATLTNDGAMCEFFCDVDWTLAEINSWRMEVHEDSVVDYVN